MKLKFKYSKTPWILQKNSIKTIDKMREIAKVFGLNTEERNDNATLMICAPDLLNALLAEEAYCSMDCIEGDQVLKDLGYDEDSMLKGDFVKELRKKALKKCGII